MKRNQTAAVILASLAMAVLILDTKTALQGGHQGIQLCLQTLIPSLFPFFLISNLLTSSLLGRKIPAVEKLLRLPSGSGSIFLVGLLGGYPVGAQAVSRGCEAKQLSASDGKRMLAFCSNAGPAFLFGIGARLFSDVWICWLLWAIHIASAMLVGFLTPGISQQGAAIDPRPLSLPQALKRSVETLGLVCGWVVLFRILLAFAQRWFLWLLPQTGQILFSGILEIANGCSQLTDIPYIGLRFSLCAVFLAFGGLCVGLQTHSVAGNVDTSLYLPGKITQAAISCLLSLPLQALFPVSERCVISFPLTAICGIICIGYTLLCRKIQKRGRNLLPLGV